MDLRLHARKELTGLSSFLYYSPRNSLPAGKPSTMNMVFGQHLRRERELRGVCLKDITQATRISQRFLEYMENDRWDQLPGGVFRRAFVRQYASFLGLDVDKTVADFVYSQKGPEPPPPATPTKGNLPWIAVGVCAALVAGLVLSRVWVANSSKRSSVLPPAPSIVTIPEESEIYTGTGQPEQGLIMTLEAKENCWVEAQVDGQVVLNRVLNQGETTTLEASGEIRLSVGNAGGLVFQVNDRPGLPLGRSGEVKRDIRITRENLPSLLEENKAPAGAQIG
jgi:cytoskeleton protein RodZ